MLLATGRGVVRSLTKFRSAPATEGDSVMAHLTFDYRPDHDFIAAQIEADLDAETAIAAVTADDDLAADCIETR